MRLEQTTEKEAKRDVYEKDNIPAAAEFS